HGFHRLEKLHVLRVGAGPATFDVVDAEPIQAAGDAHFVFRGEGHPFPLGSVPQRRIEQMNSLCHGVRLLCVLLCLRLAAASEIPNRSGAGRHATVSRPASKAAILSSYCKVMPMSSKPSSKQCRRNSSTSKKMSKPPPSKRRHCSKSTVNS